MQKIFVNSKQINNNRIDISEEDEKHLFRVLRMQNGEKIYARDLDNRITYLCEIQNESVNIVEKVDYTTESNVELDVYQGLPKSDKMELIIQKTVEIGANKIIPVDMKFSIMKMKNENKLERWNKIAMEAAKQSKRDVIPTVEGCISINDLAKRINEYDVFLICYEDEDKKTLKEVLQKLPQKDKYRIGFLVGPEGGIEKSEVEELKSNGAEIVTLGKTILRTETAPIVTASNIIYEMGK